MTNDGGQRTEDERRRTEDKRIRHPSSVVRHPSRAAVLRLSSFALPPGFGGQGDLGDLGGLAQDLVDLAGIWMGFGYFSGVQYTCKCTVHFQVCSTPEPVFYTRV